MINETFPVLRPLLPKKADISAYIGSIDENRWYSNGGPLVSRFEERLAQYFQVDALQIATVCNGTLALSQCLRVFGAPQDSVCLMPSWTFVATPAAALAAGLEPYFLDVDPETWLITPSQVKEFAAKRPVGAVVVVSAFGAPVDLAPWDALTRETGIKVIVDAAAGFDSFRAIGASQHTTPVMISFHATKVSGIGEGAVLLTGEDGLGAKMKAMGNFGFYGNRNAELPGINTKLSEYAGALGNALLDLWDTHRQDWYWLKSEFLARLSDRNGYALTPGFEGDWISSYGQILLPDHMAAGDVITRLAARGIEARQWWGNGCHRHEAYQRFQHGELPVTQDIAARLVGLPYWIGMTSDDFDHVFEAVDHLRSA